MSSPPPPLLIPPEPIEVIGPGALRFAAGRPDGLRSLTWRVEGRTNRRGQDEIYIGNRQTMGDVKLTLHQADGERKAAWRLAFTSEFAQRSGEQRKVLFENDEAVEIAGGWRQAAVILTPTFTFGKFPEKPLGNGESIQWFTEPPLPDLIKFYVMVGEPGHLDLNMTDHIGEVGHIKLTNGRQVGVVADARPTDVAFVELLRDKLLEVMNTPDAYPFTYEVAPTGFTCFLDLAVMLATDP